MIFIRKLIYIYIMSYYQTIIVFLGYFLGLNAVFASDPISDQSCFCGNGIQDVLPQKRGTCPYLLYGIRNNGVSLPSTLLYANMKDGTARSLGDIDQGLTDINAMDFSPDGILYVIGRLGNLFALASVDCHTAAAKIIGTFSVDEGSNITSMNFNSQGRLYAHRTAAASSSRTDGVLLRVDRVSGALTDIGHTQLGQVGNAIAFAPFPDGSLFHAGTSIPFTNALDGRSLSVISVISGFSTYVTPLYFSSPISNNPIINDMDFDPLTNTMYASVDDSPEGDNSPRRHYIAKLDTSTGVVSLLALSAKLAPGGLAALAVNRPYETCDTTSLSSFDASIRDTSLPSGTTCSILCSLSESDCGDGIDNDLDGHIDCADGECQAKVCNNFSCSKDTYYEGSCIIGNLLDCDDKNSCTDDSCYAASCLNSINTANSCTDHNDCTIDSCASDGNCVSDPIDSAVSCDDGSSCTINDSCQEGQCIGERIIEDCTNDIDDNCDGCIDGKIDLNDNLCSDWQDPECAQATAQEGECYDAIDNDLDGFMDCADPDCNGLACVDDGNPCTDGFCSSYSCQYIANNTNSCSDNNPCTDDHCGGGVCLGVNDDSNSCDDKNECSINDLCRSGSCQGTSKNCNDSNSCTRDFCVNGVCSFSPLSGASCAPDSNSCTADVCNNGICTHQNNDALSCNDDLTCTKNDHCATGVCIGTSSQENCQNGIDDDCDFKIDSDDSDCAQEWYRVFVTKDTYNADFKSVQKADKNCQDVAHDVLPGKKFVAFISSNFSNARDRLINQYNRPWYLFTSVPAKIANNKNDLLDGAIIQSINADERGNYIGNPKFVWTGSNFDGTNKTGFNCNNWTTQKASIKGTRGGSDKSDSKWSDQPDATCIQQYRLYCFQIDGSSDDDHDD